jgi:hypothetical protein
MLPTVHKNDKTSAPASRIEDLQKKSAKNLEKIFLVNVVLPTEKNNLRNPAVILKKFTLYILCTTSTVLY